MTFADDQIVYRDLTGPWGSFRLVVGGQDVTAFRDVPAQVGGYQLTEPYGYGPADFQFPQITAFETDAWGTGDLAWFDMGKPAELVQVDDAGVKVRIVWRGFISQVDVSDDGTSVHCDGEASGRLSMLDKHDELFYFTKDTAKLLWEQFSKAGLKMAEARWLETGIDVYERGRSGGTRLAFCDELLAEAWTKEGDQLTVRPLEGARKYEAGWKDRATVHASVDYGAAGVSLNVSRDLQEEPTTFYGHGRDENGALWVNAKAPGLVQGDPPPFPGVLSLGDSGEDVVALQRKLQGMGYLDAEDAPGDVFNDATEEAVQALQDEAGLADTGVVNQATWDALFDVNMTGPSLRGAFVAPTAQLSAVRKANRTSNGSFAGFNDGYDPERVEVDITRDWKVTRKRRARQHDKRELARIHAGPPAWHGTLDLETDLVAGAHDGITAPTALLSRLDLTAGMNVRVDNFHGDTLFHVSAVNVDSDLRVRALIDTKARDAMTVAAIRERNREARIKPGRVFLQERRTAPNSRIVEFSGELGGKIWNTINVPAETWVVFPVVAGQSGSINRVRCQVEDSLSEFVLAATAREVSAAWWERLESAPLAANAFRNERVYDNADDARAILGIWGTNGEPGGYGYGSKADGDPLNGLLVEDAGFPYHTFGQPVIYMAIWARQACKIKPQRILYPVYEAGM